ncbi:PucR family transcriptional regulator [Cohnella thermotolerans]|uniref:PucR family transcriptional regulator n=1 Tax=Cohnella thermotolerans TaxID=329858 RepID=UPI000420A23B|nr:PucR family transcriptional regulator [Cohnella thermotolerans]
MNNPMKTGFAVKDLFMLPHFKDAVLLGGGSNVDRIISRVNVMEVPDVIDWVRPGEFLMTTGYPFRHNPEVLVTLIPQLAQKGVVALGVKPKRFFDEVPEAAIEAAERHRLPLIELPPGTTFSDVVREVMERVLVSEFKDLTILQGRVQRLSHVLLHGDGLPAFMQHLELMIRSPIVLLDPENEKLASPGAEALCERIGSAEWERLRAERALETNVITVGEESLRVHVAPVADEQIQPYLLLVMDRRNEYDVVDSLTVNWAARLLGFEINNMQARRNIEAKYFDQFLQDWMAGRIVSIVDLRLRAEACGLKLAPEAHYTAGIVSFRHRKPKVRELQELAKRLNSDSAIRKLELKWTVLEGDLVVLLTHYRGETGGSRGELIQQAAAMTAQLLPDLEPSLCLGREALDQEEVAESYLDAKRVVEIRGVCDLKDPVLHYGDMGIYLLLYRLQGTEELGEFRKMYLRPLLEMDKKQQGELLKTLKTYFQCNCNAKETAERLFVHYNTIIYRLERIKGELGLRLDDPETKLILQFAIKLNELKELA